ncbi:BLUF domain-containing protein [Luteimonas sp. BDR2-5]|uniref:BLUF domain-containing protein n=1 Tax=Proluteimonas luteida TaxID=2878685 RepID=UPI001E438FFC|nr:BLUF domain-containing protein [Luteimonas sp. BDR2-5]MCD9027183.1 BLUF domain-containing protein [Luteimonas sp. BDR2-5]
MTARLLYRSAQLYEFTAAQMRQLVRRSRACNAAHGITGLLLYRDGLFLHLLEGGAGAIEALYARIAGDPRHCEVRLLARDARASRLLPGWDLAWAEVPVDDSGVPAFAGLDSDARALRLLARAPDDDAMATTLRRFLAGAPIPSGRLACAATGLHA